MPFFQWSHHLALLLTDDRETKLFKILIKAEADHLIEEHGHDDKRLGFTWFSQSTLTIQDRSHGLSNEAIDRRGAFICAPLFFASIATKLDLTSLPR